MSGAFHVVPVHIQTNIPGANVRIKRITIDPGLLP